MASIFNWLMVAVVIGTAFGDLAEVRRQNDCPYPCTVNGHHFCHPIPCPLPPCVDSITEHGICCPSCPDGPNCPAPDGHTIPWKHSEMIDGKNCTCEHPLTQATCV
ncbi:hypothetical protein ACF0H5_023299 [Mactra antiquata]